MDKKKEGLFMYLWKLRKDIVDIINKSTLDIDMVYFVIKDIMGEITTLYNKEIISQEQQKEKKEEEEK